MKTLTDVQTAGYRVEQKIRLEHGGPWGNERGVPLAPATPASPSGGASSAARPSDRFIKNEFTQLYNAVPADKQEAAKEAMARGDVVLLGAEDFPAEPTVTRFTEREGDLKYGGPGGYPYREKKFETFESQPLTQFVRDMTGFPTATWAIRPQTGSWPDAPDLFIFVPVGNGGALTEQEAAALLFGKFGEKTPDPAKAGGTVRVDGDAVYIGSIRVDRRQGYFVEVTDPRLRAHS